MRTLLCIILASLTLQAIAQKREKSRLDTIYYLADTIKIPKNDRMLTVFNEVNSRLGKPDTIQVFRINCKCLPHEFYPTFTRHLSKPRKEISELMITKIKFISLPELLNLVLKDYEKEFYYNHVIMIVERVNDKYFSSEVFLTKYGGPVN